MNTCTNCHDNVTYSRLCRPCVDVMRAHFDAERAAEKTVEDAAKKAKAKESDR